ncbi:DUF1207 domain-containing protein [Spirosoma radiotolerans]|uniref:DUF1207 domain-containing protein n=1 Tax=Spirosoma radiotolerans TaxID=1379870 RepID=A0A0E3V947_9BACT|nr:DUF1207 domain-containing protein [Spirosoma radiotolerans]AKD57352.1 hypothetical protein SD10_23155 [Spirosoma radiotolerans]
MKQTLSVLLLSILLGAGALAQTPTTPPARVLTPAEQRQKEKIDREVQRERQIRAEWLQKQREYEARQAEKERQRAAKKAGKPIAPPAPVTAPASTGNPPSTSTPAPTVAEPTRKEKREQRKKEAASAPTPANAPVAEPDAPPAPAAEAPVTTPRPERVKRERKPKPVSSEPVVAESNRDASVVRPGREFLPKGHLFDPILLDPLEAQTYGSILPGYWTEGKKYKGSIVPFAFGFAKPFYRRSTDATHAEEWVLDLASFTQFEAYHDDVQDKARRQIMNTDYKISIIYNVRRGENNYRFRVYHISSHLGDDYIYRNKLTAPSPNSVNYEQLDATYSRVVDNWRLYGGLGIVLRKAEERKLMSAQLGAFYKKPSASAARLVGGVDIKFWQQTDFRPGIHGGIGIELGRTQNNLTFLLEGYSGFRPYSQYEQQQTSWIGVGLYLNPF